MGLRSARVIRFVENLRITSGKGAGKRFKLRGWQKKIIRDIYDPVDENGKRKIRKAVLSMPRKNGKTTLIAALCLCHLIGPERTQRGQIYSAAADVDQAGLIYEEAAAMVRADRELNRRLVCRDGRKRIVHKASGSFYRAISSTPRSKHGFNASVVICDELAQAKNRELYDVLTTSYGAREEPLELVISVQGSHPHHIMTQLVTYTNMVNSGEVEDESFVGWIYAAPEDTENEKVDIYDEKVWYACNPALGDFRSLEEMRAFARQAKHMPSLEQTFRGLYLNQRVSDLSRAIPLAEWNACAGEFNIDDLRGRPCWGGLDLSSADDLTAFVLYFPFDRGVVLPWFWVPGRSMQKREERDNVPYLQWKKKGLIASTESAALDKTAICKELLKIKEIYDIKSIGYDRWGVKALKAELTKQEGELPLEEFGQGFKDMGEGYKSLIVSILNKKLMHGRHPCLNWCMANAVVVQDPSGNKKFDKENSDEKIDGAVATAMAVGTFDRREEDEEFTSAWGSEEMVC